MLIDEESDNFGLFLEGDRNEFIFHIFRFLVLGGKWCQYEDKINPYLELTKMLYKNLVRFVEFSVSPFVPARTFL